MSVKSKALNILKIEEGFRSKPYLCSEGYVTVGYGQKLDDRRGLNPSDFNVIVTRDEAERYLIDQIRVLDNQLEDRFGVCYTDQSDDRRAVLISMAYQLGISGVSKFKNMWSGLCAHDFDKAYIEALDSKWASQTPKRAHRHAAILHGNTVSMYQLEEHDVV